MSHEQPETLVAAIVKDFMVGANAPWKEACVLFHRAVRTLRTTAGNSGSSISEQDRREIDAAIAAAQPIIVGRSPATPTDLRFLVGGLHVITAEWANPNRQPIASVSANVMEAFLLARMLENWLDSANLTNLLQGYRDVMDDQQWVFLRDLLDDLYPLATAAAPTHFAEGAVH